MIIIIITALCAAICTLLHTPRAYTVQNVLYTATVAMLMKLLVTTIIIIIKLTVT